MTTRTCLQAPPPPAGGSTAEDKACVLQGINEALTQAYLNATTVLLLARRLENGRMCLSVEKASDPVQVFNKACYLIGTTDRRGTELLLHPAWAEWLSGETNINPTNKWSLGAKDHERKRFIRAAEGQADTT